MAELVGFPKAPLTPIMVSFMRCRESRPFVGSFEARPKVGEVVAFIPYLDLPNYALDEERAIAFIDADGFRGWISKDDVSTHFDIMDATHDKCWPFFGLFERQGWEATPILWSAIDWPKHFQLRSDDLAYDMSPEAFFANCDLITSCSWCGHPQMNDKHGKPVNGDQCEACEWGRDDEEKDRKKRESLPVVKFDENNSETGFLGEDWA